MSATGNRTAAIIRRAPGLTTDREAIPLGTRLTRGFARHYAEMVVVMLVGMAVLAMPARLITAAVWPQVAADDPALMLARMAAAMTLPMIVWMRWRGHGWQPSLEMAGAMIVPALAVIALLGAGVVEAVWLLMTVEHVAMFGAMFAVMLARPHEYSHVEPRSPRPVVHAAVRARDGGQARPDPVGLTPTSSGL